MANAVSNVTACDGFVEGWKDWCTDHLVPCAKLAMMGAIPGTLDNNQTWDFCWKDSENGWGFNNLIAPCHDSKIFYQVGSQMLFKLLKKRCLVWSLD